MNITPTTYIPVLRWRLAEYQALLRLSDDAKDRVVPIIMVPPLEYDPEDGRLKKTIQEVVAPFAKRVNLKWNERSAWIDFDSSLVNGNMDDGVAVVTHVFNELREFNSPAVPISWLDAGENVIGAVREIQRVDRRGIGVRLKLENLMAVDISNRIKSLAQKLDTGYSEIDLILELGKSFEPYEAFSNALFAGLSRVSILNKFRSFVLTGTSMLESLGEIDTPGATIPRHEWLFYQYLINNLRDNVRRPNFGDYTIVAPTFSMNFNMALIKPAGRIIYTYGGNWIIRKGSAFRDNPNQMRAMCSNLIGSGKFRGEDFSDGDKQIYLCANNQRNTSNLGGWKRFGINHHIMHVLDDLANIGAGS